MLGEEWVEDLEFLITSIWLIGELLTWLGQKQEEKSDCALVNLTFCVLNI